MNTPTNKNEDDIGFLPDPQDSVGPAPDDASPAYHRLHGELLELRRDRQQLDELREARRLLEERDRQKDQFIAMLGHELRNPLAAISTASQVLSMIQVDHPRFEHVKGVLKRQTAAMGQMLNDLLDVSSLATGRADLERGSVDLALLLSRAVTAQEEAAVRAAVKLSLTLPAGCLRVHGDQARLSQIIDNLLSNALKYTPAGGSVTVVLEPADGRYLIHVQDTGTGFDPALEPHLFNPYGKVGPDHARRSGGLGLGLAISRMLAELHDGSLVASSDGPGQGAVFTLELPCEAASPSERTTPVDSGEARRILVIEDNADVATSMQDLLELAGYDVAVAYDGASGMARGAAFRPQLVLCDLGLPGLMNGFDVARSFRDTPSLASIPLIAVSGYNRPEDLERAKASGFDQLVAKPIELVVIQRILQDISAGTRH